ncbi:rRNA biogenesis protein rrp36-like [Drosophila miranda]|uniref:rRNA biogenesis protein rrp36-like n=1 Tax=Drosophila miranda TaxID=7229 RepID=UPI0007E75E2D|nr:rRNA biogenesis protein rrp36-like [Drosophila miranda]
MNRNPQVCSARIAPKVLLDAEESQLVRCRDTAVCPYVENSELVRDKTPETPLEISPYSNNPEISQKLQDSKSGSGKSTAIGPDVDDSQLVCYSEQGSDEDLNIGPSEDDEDDDDGDEDDDDDDDDDDEDDYQSGVQIIEIPKTPRGVAKVTRDRSEINMRLKRWQDKLNAYKGLVERNRELFAIYEEKRLAVAAGLAEITREMYELGCWPDGVPEGQGDGADANETA